MYTHILKRRVLIRVHWCPLVVNFSLLVNITLKSLNRLAHLPILEEKEARHTVA